MNFAKIVALTSFVLASTGCAVGSEDHELPTPQPAHEFSAPLQTRPADLQEKAPWDTSLTWADWTNPQYGPTYVHHPEVQKVVVNSPPLPNGSN